MKPFNSLTVLESIYKDDPVPGGVRERADMGSEPMTFGGRMRMSLLHRRPVSDEERVLEKVNKEIAANEVACAALRTLDKAKAAVRGGEQKLKHDRAVLAAAEAAYEQALPGTRCPCWRCDNERHRPPTG